MVWLLEEYSASNNITLLNIKAFTFLILGLLTKLKAKQRLFYTRNQD